MHRILNEGEGDTMHMRLASWDYSSNGIYFVTFCTYRKKCLFGTVEQPRTNLDAPRMTLNAYGKACEKCIEAMSALNPGVALETFVVMPNHVHLLIRVQDSELTQHRSTVSRVIGGIKAATAKVLHEQGYEGQVWQTGFYDHVCRNEADYQRIYHYIETNPSKWLTDRFWSC